MQNRASIWRNRGEEDEIHFTIHLDDQDYKRFQEIAATEHLPSAEAYDKMMDEKNELPECFSYDELVKALLERFKPYLLEIIREELANMNNELSVKNSNKKYGIVATEPDVKPDGRYSINETCDALGISAKTLYRYIDNGLIRAGIRRSNGRKFISGSEIKRFWKSRY